MQRIDYYYIYYHQSFCTINNSLTLIKVGFLGVCLVMGGEGVKLYVPLSKTCTQTYAVSENIPFSTTTPLILLMSALFFQKDSIFLSKIVPLLKAIV